MFPIKFLFLIILGCTWFDVSYSVYQFIGSEKDAREAFQRSASVDIIWVTRRDHDSGKQTTWIKESLPQRYVCVGCQLKSDRALRLLCLKGNVRARHSTLWQYCWQEASEFFCITYLFLEGVEQPKTSPKTPENALSDALLSHVFKISRLTPLFFLVLSSPTAVAPGIHALEEGLTSTHVSAGRLYNVRRLPSSPLWPH